MRINLLRPNERRFSFAAVRRVAVVSGLVCLIPLAGCDQSHEPAAPASPSSIKGPAYTLASGSTSTLLGRATFADNFNIQRMDKDAKWKTKIVSDPLDIAVQSIVFAPGAQSGWHSHPGPVFIMVVEGTMKFYESDDPSCTAVVRTAGQGYLDVGDHAHIARNETAVPAKNIVTYLAPPGATLRIDQPSPGNCPF